MKQAGRSSPRRDVALVGVESPLVREVVYRELGRLEVEGRELGDAQEVRSASEVRDVALILLDLGLPGVDVLELLRCLRPNELSVPVLVLTRKDHEPLEKSVRELGALVVPKPIRPLELRDLVLSLLAAPDVRLGSLHHPRQDQPVC